MDTDSPREYLTGDFFHTNAGLFNSHAYSRAAAVIPPLAPEADDSDLAMTEAFSPNAVAAPVFNNDVVMHDELDNSITYNAAALVHFTPPLNYEHPARKSTRIEKPLRSSIRPQRAQAGHEQRLQWQNILDAQKDLQARSPSDYFRAVVEINTERNTPKKSAFITPTKNNHVTGTNVAQTTTLFTPPNISVPPPTPPIRKQYDLLEHPSNFNFIHSQVEPKPSALLAAELINLKEPQILPEESSPFRTKAASEPDANLPSAVLVPKGPDPALFKKPSPRPDLLTLPGAYNFSSSTTVSPSSIRKRKMDDMSSGEGDAPRPQTTVPALTEQISVQEMPFRQYGAMFFSVITRMPSIFHALWARVAGMPRVEERVAVETPANRHKRRAVSPTTTSSSPKSSPSRRSPSRRSSRRSSASRSPSTLPSSPPAIVVQSPEPLKTEAATTREDTPLRVEPVREAPINPLVRYNELRAHAAVIAETQIMRDGKTEKQIRKEIEAEGVERNVPISPNDPRRTRRLGQHRSRRPMSAHTHAKIDAERDKRVNRLLEASREIVRNRPPPRPPVKRRGMSMKEKLRQMDEAKAAAAAQQKEAEEAEWAAQLQIETELNARDAEEAEAKRQAELKASISITDPLIKPVSETLADSIDKAMSVANPSRQVATLLDGSSLSKYDLERVVSNGGRGTSSWLNDNAVNGWFKAIVERKKDEVGYKKTSSTSPPFAAMNSAWLDNVQKKGMKSISRWSKRMDVSGAKLLQSERIFFPINSGSHWTLLIISPQDRQISFLDSLGGEGPRYIAHAREWLAMELGNAYVADDWTEVIGQSSAQDNMDDCGVFTCLNGLASAKGREFTEVNPDRMPLARRMIAAVLLSGEVDL
jgi:hypothetical protein